MPEFIDTYYDDLVKVQNTLIDKVNKMLPKLETLTETELIELSRSLDFFDELRRLGYDNLVRDFEASFNGEMAGLLKKAGDFGVSAGSMNLEAVEYLMSLETTFLVKNVGDITDTVKREVFKGLINGDSVNDIAGRLTKNFKDGQGLVKSRVTVNDGISRLFNTTTQKIFEDEPSQRFEYIGPLDTDTRDECSAVLNDSRNDQGFTAEEISGLAGITFGDRGGWNCRHDWVPV